MKFRMSEKTRQKLATKHGGVSDKEIEECFENRNGKDLFDTRAEHLTDPLTRWFLAYTNHRRLLKIVFIPDAGVIEIKSVYEPNDEEIRIYRKYGLQT